MPFGLMLAWLLLSYMLHLSGVRSAGCTPRCRRALCRLCLAAGDLSLACFGGLVRSFLGLLAYFGGLTKIYSSTFLGDATPVSWLSWPDVRLFSWLDGFPSSDPLLLALLVPRRLTLANLMARQPAMSIAFLEGVLMGPKATRCSSCTPYNSYLC